MAKTLDEVRLDALSLPDEDRRALSEDLLDSLQTADDRAFVSSHLDEWERRAEEMMSGAVKGIPLEDVVRELMAKYGGAGRASS